ncbi:MAG: DUF2235 domain-containing protein [Pseudomonadota bacterium]
MTRIAIFCDGTWNSPSIPETTHVHKLQKAVRHMPENGQVSVYFAGVGTDEDFDGPVRRFFNRWGGGAFGWGLDTKVKRAYQFIAQVYQPGDEIYLFGFSRGAFTARSVAGMIRKCGIVQDSSEAGINEAWKLYRKKGRRNAPDMDHILTWRRKLSPKFATSQADQKWRGDQSDIVKIAYIGVWDTVGARGLPLAVLGPIAAIWNRQYKFHDMNLSSLVRSARHAVALDEMRRLYKPALWDNLDGKDGLNQGRDKDALRPYQQVWFVGNHGIVGGSAETQELAAYPLMWVLEGAGRLVRDPNAYFPPTRADALIDSTEVAPKTGLLASWRKGPRVWHRVHPSVKQRLDGRTDYRPRSLDALS